MRRGYSVIVIDKLSFLELSVVVSIVSIGSLSVIYLTADDFLVFLVLNHLGDIFFGVWMLVCLEGLQIRFDLMGGDTITEGYTNFFAVLSWKFKMEFQILMVSEEVFCGTISVTDCFVKIKCCIYLCRFGHMFFIQPT